MAGLSLYQAAILVTLEPFGSERNGLIEADITADDSRLSNDDSRPMVDEEAFADLRAGMNVNRRLRMGELGYNPRNHQSAK